MNLDIPVFPNPLVIPTEATVTARNLLFAMAPSMPLLCLEGRLEQPKLWPAISLELCELYHALLPILHCVTAPPLFWDTFQEILTSTQVIMLIIYRYVSSLLNFKDQYLMSDVMNTSFHVVLMYWSATYSHDIWLIIWSNEFDSLQGNLLSIGDSLVLVPSSVLWNEFLNSIIE